MKEYILKSPGVIVILEKNLMEINKEEVLIKVTNVGLCGSDIHLFNGTYKGPTNYPMLFGHEWSGIIEKVGTNVNEFKRGDKVTGDCSCYCGNCELCEVDKNLCLNIKKFGLTIDGASAEYIIRNHKYIYKAPEEIELDMICLSEPLAVAAHLINKIIKISPNIKEKKILIYGCGPIGISILLLLRIDYGCNQVFIKDVVKERLELGKQLGGIIEDESMLNKSDKIDNSTYNSMYSNTEFDIIIETTGSPAVFKNIFELIKPAGLIGCIGMMQEVSINQKMIVIKGLTIIGSIGGTGEFTQVLDFTKNNKEIVKRLISHKIPIRNIYEAFNIGQDPHKAMKVQLILNTD